MNTENDSSTREHKAVFDDSMLYLDQNRFFSQNSIFRELQKQKDVSCTVCPYSPERDQRKTDYAEVPICRN